MKFDNHVSLGNVLTVIVAIIAVATWGNRLENSVQSTAMTAQADNRATNTRVEAIEKSDQAQNIVLEALRAQNGTINTSLARVQERQDTANDNLREIKDILRDEPASTRRKRSSAAQSGN